ncbi:hypothetical protein [Pseudoalteromonas umbrosa]|uniref:hypothetical protein n=1 Tax=Pseudoalteromonas umbrosa TaxID=3048489 RepID=UPI0024C2890C|nr:hypothetical protein [Pseudoalteromonas sp. B95]MDK1290104.1 hypothetical protein [Pseudoalteromonas sp. B95]
MKNILDQAAKKATLFHIRTTENITWEKLNSMAYQPDTALDGSNKRMGLVHPLSTLDIAPEADVLEKFDGGFIGTLRIDSSVITATAIKQAAAVRIKEKSNQLPPGVKLSKEERESITMAVRMQLLKGAAEVTTHVPFIIDLANSRLIIFSTKPDVLNAITLRINNMFSAELELLEYSSFAVKADILNISAKLLEKLKLYHESHVADAQEVTFNHCPDLSFGMGMKLISLDDTSGNHGNFPSIDVTDDSLGNLITRATGIEKLGLFLVHNTCDLEFTINSKLQFEKLGLASVLLNGVQSDDQQDPTGEIRATAQIIADTVNFMQKNVINWLGMSEHIR